MYVTGMGIISALGAGIEQNRMALRAQTSGLTTARYLQSRLAAQLPLGEVPFSNTTLASMAGLTPGTENRLVLLATVALNEALGSHFKAGLVRTGFINATSVGGMADVENMYSDLIDPAIAIGNLSAGDSLDCAQGTEILARHFGIRQQVATISTACSSSANAIMYGARLVQAGLLDRVVCGGVDTLTRFTLNGFSSLRNTDTGLCKPFDEHRNGLNLGEGAAYLVLESERSLAVTGSKPVGLLAGYHNYNEAFHPTAPSPDGNGAYEAMAGALHKAGLLPAAISYINAHGTATINNDIAEAKAMLRLFGGQLPPFSSTKCYTGHTLAAAGAIEAVFSLLAIVHEELYPALHFDTPMNDAAVTPLLSLTEHRKTDHVLSNSFGFGGNNACLILSRYA